MDHSPTDNGYLDISNISLNENAIQVCLGRVITAPTPLIIQYLFGPTTGLLPPRTGLNYSRKNHTSQTIRKQCMTSSHYRSRKCPVTLKMHVQRVARESSVWALQRAVLRLTWQPSTPSWKKPNSQFHSTAVQTDTQWKVSLHSTKFYPKLHIANTANSPVMEITVSQ